MKRLQVICAGALLLLSLGKVSAQNSVGVGTETPNPNAVLHLVSPTNNQGLLVPKLTTAQRTAAAFVGNLAATDNGLMVFDVSEGQFYYWLDGSWELVSGLMLSAGTGITLDTDTGILTNTGDLDIANEIQDLQLNGEFLSITDNPDATVIDLTPFLDDQLAAQVPVTPNADLLATNVQAALVELQAEVIAAGGGLTNLSDGTILVGDAANLPVERIISGDLVIDNAGVATIQPGSISATELADLSVTGGISVGAKIDANTIEEGNMAASSVSGGSGGTITDNSITTDDIGTGGVDSDEIAANAVITTKIQDDNVTLAKIANGAGNEILVTNLTGNPTYIAPGNDRVVVTDAGGNITSESRSNFQNNVLPQGSIYVGDASDEATPLDASTLGAVLMGTGVSVTSQVISGDVNVAPTGTSTIQPGVVGDLQISDVSVGKITGAPGLDVDATDDLTTADVGVATGNVVTLSAPSTLPALDGSNLTGVTATNFSGALTGDVTGSQGTTVVSSVGGETAANVATAAGIVNGAAALDVDATDDITNVTAPAAGDVSGDFATGLTVDAVGGETAANVATATGIVNGAAALDVDATDDITNVTAPAAGDVSGDFATGLTVDAVGGETAANVATATGIVNGAAALDVDATDDITNVTAPAAGDVSGDFATGLTVDVVGGETAANVATATGIVNGAAALDVDATDDITNVTAPAAGDVSGDFATGLTVDAVGGETSANVATATGIVNGAAALDVDATDDITNVTAPAAGDVSGDFATGLTVDAVGGETSANVATATGIVNGAAALDVDATDDITNVTAPAAGDVSGDFATGLTVDAVGGETAVNVATATGIVNGAAALDVDATDDITNVTAPAAGDVSGDFATGLTVDAVGGETAVNVATATGIVNGAAALDVDATDDITNVTAPAAGDVSGDFATGLTVDAVGGETATNVATATGIVNGAAALDVDATDDITNVTAPAAGDVSGDFATGLTVDAVGGETAANVATATGIVNGAAALDVDATDDVTDVTAPAAGDVSGDFATGLTVDAVGGETAANVATATGIVNGAAALDVDATDDITNVTAPAAGDVSGDFATGLTVDVVGGETAANVATATGIVNGAAALDVDATDDVTDVTAPAAGDVSGDFATGLTVDAVGGETAANVATATGIVNGATALDVDATDDVTDVTAPAAGDVSGDFATGLTVDAVGGETAANVATATGIVNGATALDVDATDDVTDVTAPAAGDVSGDFATGLTVDAVGGETAANVATATNTVNTAAALDVDATDDLTTADVGVATGNVVTLSAPSTLPALDGSALTGVSVSGVLIDDISNFVSVGANTGIATGDNTFIGDNVGSSISTGIFNTFIGSNAGLANDLGDDNVFVGAGSGSTNADGISNTFLGSASGANNFDGSFNTFLGVDAGLNNNGSDNIFIGSLAGSTNAGGNNNLVIGNNADVLTGGLSNAIAIGDGAVVPSSDMIALGNGFVGEILLSEGVQKTIRVQDNTTGSGNSLTLSAANGAAGTFNGGDVILNPGINGGGGVDGIVQVNGDMSISGVISGDGSGLAGVNISGVTVDAGNNFVSLGNATGAVVNSNTLIGANSGQNNIGSGNTFIGSNSASSNTSGTSNIFIGNNVGIGSTSGTANQIGSGNVLIGTGSDVLVDNLTNAIAIGANAVVPASNTIALGNGNMSTFLLSSGSNKVIAVENNPSATANSLSIQSGTATTTGDGGALSLSSGLGENGGNLVMASGTGSAGAGGDITLNVGSGESAGSINLNAGPAFSSAVGGNINLAPGAGTSEAGIVDIAAPTALRLPVGVLAERPSSSVNGLIRYSIESGVEGFEGYSAAEGGWVSLGSPWSGSPDISYSGGNVGIGLATPSTPLDVLGTITARDNTINPKLSLENTINQDVPLRFLNPSYTWMMGVDQSATGDFVISSSASFGTNDRFVINRASGQLNINTGAGTANPLIITSSAGAGGQSMQFVHNGITTSLGDNNIWSRVGTVSNHDFSIIANDSDIMRFTAAGQVGIGTATPLAGTLLNIEGNINNSAETLFLIENTNASATANGMEINLGITDAIATNRFITFSSDGGNFSQVGSITGNGAGQISYNTTSDRRLKANIINLAGSLQIIDQIRPRTFSYKKKPDVRLTGFIAQELYEVFPEVVIGTPDNDIENPMMVNYSGFSALLTAGVQELHQKIKKLESVIEMQNQQIEDLKSTNTSKDQQLGDLKEDIEEIKLMLGLKASANK